MNNPIRDLVEEINAAEPKPIPEELSDIDRMMGEGYKLAKKYLVGSNDRELVPSWHMVTETGQEMLVATPFDGDERTKDMVAEGMRKFMRETNVVRYTFTTEAWVAKLTKEEWEAGDRRPPSKRDDRCEIVLVAGCDRSGASVKIYEIEREWDSGKVTGLKPMSETPMTDFQGRFANLLS